MKPWTTLGTEGALTLRQRGDEFAVFSSGQLLMGSRRHGSEDALARAGLEGAAPAAAVLIGGLGFGYTLRAALDLLPADGRVVVAERAEAIVAWNRGPLRALAGAPLEDGRVELRVEDVADILRGDRGAYDAVLLDVDNGPYAVTHQTNHALYGARGLERAAAALRPGGRLVVWSAGDEPRFTERLRRAGFDAEARRVRADSRSRAAHVLFVGVRR